MVVGCVLVSPVFFNREAFDNGLSFLLVGFGICLILIGVSRLGTNQGSEDTEGAAPTIPTAATLNQEVSRASTRPLLSGAFRILGHLTVALTVLGVAYLLFFAPAGSASGVPVGIGLLLAGAFYGLAAIAKR